MQIYTQIHIHQALIQELSFVYHAYGLRIAPIRE
jgi:hypothetical protein